MKIIKNFPFLCALDQLIGKGSFGSVYKAMWRDNVVAVKTLSVLPENGPLVEV
jgi:serine/threonine protein kinase